MLIGLFKFLNKALSDDLDPGSHRLLFITAFDHKEESQQSSSSSTSADS